MTLPFLKLYVSELLRCVQLPFVTLRHVTSRYVALRYVATSSRPLHVHTTMQPPSKITAIPICEIQNQKEWHWPPI